MSFKKTFFLFIVLLLSFSFAYKEQIISRHDNGNKKFIYKNGKSEILTLP